jgi:cysteinyl-tRNA synthetase
MDNVQARAARFESTIGVVAVIAMSLVSANVSAEAPSTKTPADAVPIEADRQTAVPTPTATENSPATADANFKARLRAISSVKTWAAQIQSLNIDLARAAPVDLIVADATAGGPDGRALAASDVAALKVKPDGSRRLALAYLSIGESEDYRPDYFTSEYMTEDAPDWLLGENSRWKGNRLIRFCDEGWQKTIIGDEAGRSVYNSVEPSPLHRLIELGFDGVVLDRVDVYSEVRKECPDAAKRMVDFVARLAAHARKRSPMFLVVLQNAEELLEQKTMLGTVDAVIKEDLFFGVDHSERANDPVMVKAALDNLALARAAGRPVFILEYPKDARRHAAEKAKIEALGFIPYFGPRNLDQLWLPGSRF